MGHTKAKTLRIVSLMINQSNPSGTKTQDVKQKYNDSYSYGLSREETQFSYLEDDLSKRNPTNQIWGKLKEVINIHN